MTTPYVGMPVLYRLRPGQVRAGQTELAAIITRVNAARQRKVEKVITAKRVERLKNIEGKVVEKTIEEPRIVEDVQMAPESVDLTIFPPNGEPMRQENVMRMSETVTGHCWRPDDSLGAVREDLAKARADIAELSDQIKELAELVTAPATSETANGTAKRQRTPASQ